MPGLTFTSTRSRWTTVAVVYLFAFFVNLAATDASLMESRNFVAARDGRRRLVADSHHVRLHSKAQTLYHRPDCCPSLQPIISTAEAYAFTGFEKNYQAGWPPKWPR